MARFQLALGDPSGAIRMTVQNCLDLDPANENALTFLAELDGPAETASFPKDETDQTRMVEYPTIFHVLTPVRLREFTLIWWLILTGCWFGFSSGIEWFVGNVDILFPKSLQFSYSYIGIAAIIGFRSSIVKQRLPLSLQLSMMRLDRFDAWFDRQLKNIFGDFQFRDGRVALKASLKAERLFYLGGITFVFLLGANLGLVSGAWDDSFLISVLRTVDWLLMAAITYFAVRMVPAFLILVFRFSGLSLKPMLTRLNDDGLRCFGSLISYIMALVSFEFLLLGILGAEVVHTANRADFFILALALLFYLALSVVLPFMIRHAARQAKTKAVHDYSAHIEKAFIAFQKEPDSDKLERYQWLLNNQAVIQKISTWPLSKAQTLFAVIGSNLLMVAVAGRYIAIRTGRWAEFVEYIRMTLGL